MGRPSLCRTRRRAKRRSFARASLASGPVNSVCGNALSRARSPLRSSAGFGTTRGGSREKTVSGDVVVPAATTAAKHRPAVFEKTLAPIARGQNAAHIRIDSYHEALASVVERACVVDLLRQTDIKLFGVHDTRRTDASRRPEIDEVQPVIEPQPHISDEKVEPPRPALQPRTRG